MWYYITHSCVNNGVHAFPRGISPKVKVLAWLEFELVSNNVWVGPYNRVITQPRMNIKSNMILEKDYLIEFLV